MSFVTFPLSQLIEDPTASFPILYQQEGKLVLDPLLWKHTPSPTHLKHKRKWLQGK